MRGMTLRLAILVGMSALAICPAVEAEPTAVLIEMTGRCEVSSGSSGFSPARPGMGLEDGDAIAVRDGSAKILRSDGRMETIDAGKTVTIEGSRRRQSARGPLGRLWEILSNRVGMAVAENRLYSDAGAVRALPGRKIDLVSPRNTALLGAPARVEWKAHADVKTYHVRIADGDGSVVWSYTTSQTAATLDSRAAFAPGTYYFVRVSDVRRGGPASDESYFRVLPAAEAERVQQDVATVRQLAPSSDPTLLIGAVYDGWGLLENALESYGTATSPAAKRAVDTVYLKNGRRWAMAGK